MMKRKLSFTFPWMFCFFVRSIVFSIIVEWQVSYLFTRIVWYVSSVFLATVAFKKAVLHVTFVPVHPTSGHLESTSCNRSLLYAIYKFFEHIALDSISNRICLPTKIKVEVFWWQYALRMWSIMSVLCNLYSPIWAS